MRRILAALGLMAGLAPALAAAQAIPDTECDRLAGFWLMPRAEGTSQAYAVTDAYAAGRACDAARAQYPDEPFFALILSRALLIVPEDPIRTLPLVQSAVEAWPAMARMQLAFLHEFGRSGLTENQAEARRLYEEACALVPALGALASCTQAALMQVEGRGGDSDPEGGIERLGALCDAGWPQACTERMLIGEIYADDTPAEQTALLQRGCEGGDLFACSLVGLRYERGEGAPFDMSRARELYALACDGGDSYGCANLAEVYRAGIGVAPDVVRAVQLFTRACAGQDAFACTTLGHILNDAQGVPRDRGRALVAFESACALGDPEACDLADRLR